MQARFALELISNENKSLSKKSKNVPLRKENGNRSGENRKKKFCFKISGKFKFSKFELRCKNLWKYETRRFI